jgi:uncharacterized RDD family membrane protein YckC
MTEPTDPGQQPGGQPDPFAAPAPGQQPPPPQYGQPPYGQPQYGQPQYGQPQYAPPQQYAQPAYAGQGGQLATWIYRVGGRIIDGLIFGVPASIIGYATGSRVVSNLLSAVALVIVGYLNGATGQTPGKRIVGLRLIRERDGQLLGGGMGVVREIAHILDSLACLIGWFWPLWDAKRQTFADKICGTVVVRT